MPPNTVYVGRGSKWGNPFSVEEYGRDKAVDYFNECLDVPATAYAHFDEIEATIMYNRFVWMKEHLHHLIGRDLACWCSLDKKCHADVLINELNEETK